jgi:translocation and assembly module TamB
LTAQAAPSRRRWPFFLALGAGVLIGLPLLLIVVVLGALNTSPGQREAEALARSLTGGTVRLAGLHGRFPDAIRLDRLQLRDAGGPWLTISALQLDWSPLHLLEGEASIRLLFADQVSILRLPLSQPAPNKPRAGGFQLPVAIDARRLVINDLSLAAPVVQTSAHLALSGQARLRSLTNATAALDLRRTDAPGDYTVTAALAGAAITARLSVQEPRGGLISRAAHLPGLGAIGLDATLAGPRTAAALRLALAAGPLRASAAGTLDLPAQSADLAITANAPAMTLAAGLAWQSVGLNARLAGPFAHPAATGTLAVRSLQASGVAIGSVNATLAADTHAANLTAQADGVQLPAPNQSLLAGGPVCLQARLNLDDPTRTVTYAFQQHLLDGQGTATLAPTLRARLAVALPDLEVLARPRGRDVAGSAGFTLLLARTTPHGTRIDLDAAMTITGGADAPAAIRGQTTLGATVTLNGQDIDLSRLTLADSNVHLTAAGGRHAGHIAAAWHIATADLHALAPALHGAANLNGQLAGTMANFAANADLTGAIGTATLVPAPVHLALSAQNLPRQPTGQLQATAQLAGAPLTLSAGAARAADQTLTVTIHQATWKSATIAGALALPPHATLPTGALTLGMTRLADLRPIIDQPIAGSLTAALILPAAGPGSLTLDARNAGLPGRATIANAHVSAAIANLTATPSIAGQLTASGIKAGAISGALTLDVNGPLTALALKLTTTLQNLAGANATAAAAATLNPVAKTLRLAGLSADWHGEHLAAGPATLSYAPTVTVDHLQLSAAAPGASTATLQLAGRLSPTLDLTLSARNLTPALATPFAPTLNAAGTLQFDARLAGTEAAPTGPIHLMATGLRLRAGAAAGLPAARLEATATLTGHAADLAATLAAGQATHLALNGAVPLTQSGPLDLHADGAIDLQVLDPVLTPAGRRVLGDATLHAAIAGTPRAPTVTGSLRLANGEIEDFAQGIFITDIAADVEADGRTLRIATLTGKAGPGAIAATGQIGLAGAMPVDLHITAANARPIASSLVTATLDADLAIAGQARDTVRATGTVTIRRADIQLPDKLPASIAVLDVRRPGDHPAPPQPVSPALQIPLDIALNAPQQIFVRGRGLDAELGGKLHIGGTAAAPQTSGSIALRNGRFSLAGTTLNFTAGDIGFNGATKIDPALNLIATSGTAELTATLTVGGYASAPKITLSSVPDRPQDEILAALLFGQNASSLSPFQLAEIAAALAQLSGVGGGGPDPLSRLRGGLGLDRLSVGSSATQNANGTTTNTTAVEAGRYVARGVFVGAKQGVSGSQTQAEVQIDLTKGLKLNTTAGNGPGGNTVGLSYQFQY